MTVAEMTPPVLSPEERLRARALDLVKTHTLEVILGSDEPLRTVDVGRLLADRLDLDLNEEELGGLASLSRMVMDSDPLFSQANRQWNLALRMGRAEGDRRKPVERAIEDFVDLLGRPTPPAPVAELVACVYGRDADYYIKMIDRLLPRKDRLFRVGGDRIGITRWLLEMSSDDPADVEFDNFPDTSSVDQLRRTAKGVKAKDPVAYCRAIIEKADAPVDNRALLFLAWSTFPDCDPEAVFRSLCAEDDFRVERGPSWVTESSYGQVLSAVRTLLREPETASELVAAAAPLEEEESSILAPTTARVSDDDLDQVHVFMQQEERTHRLPDLCQQVLEAFPGSRTYPAIHASLLGRMREDPRFVWVGFERFRIARTIPMEVQVLPDGLAFDERDYLGEDEAEIDRAIEPRDWKFNLDEQITHYLVQDVGDDDTSPRATPSRIETSPPLHHYVSGTLYLRNSDRGFFPIEPDVVQATLIATDGSRFDVWINNRLGLVFSLKDWYDGNLPWVGGRFSIERTEQLDEFRLVHSGEVEPLMDIPMERLQQLLTLRGEAAVEAVPLTEIVQRILRVHADGIHFVHLFAEVNVVRRVRRRFLASILSGQRFFQQSPQQPGFWHYDEKRAAKAKKKGGPKRPMRDMIDDEDDDFEIE